MRKKNSKKQRSQRMCTAFHHRTWMHCAFANTKAQSASCGRLALPATKVRKTAGNNTQRPLVADRFHVAKVATRAEYKCSQQLAERRKKTKKKRQMQSKKEERNLRPTPDTGAGSQAKKARAPVSNFSGKKIHWKSTRGQYSKSLKIQYCILHILHIAPEY